APSLLARRKRAARAAEASMRVNDLMTREVKACRPEDSLARAAKLMWDHDCGSVPVVEEDGRVVGMLTDRDICMAAFTTGQPLHEVSVEQTMSRDVVRCTAHDPVEVALLHMGRARVRRLPVVDSTGHLIGIFSLHDAARIAETTWFSGVRLKD